MKRIQSILLALVTASIVSTSMAAETSADHEHHKKGDRYHSKFDDSERHGRSKREYMQDMMSREFTADEVKTLVSARLLMRGENTLKVGKIMPSDTGYTATIVTKQNGDVVRTLNLAKNGFPLERVNRWKEKMDREKQ